MSGRCVQLLCATNTGGYTVSYQVLDGPHYNTFQPQHDSYAATHSEQSLIGGIMIDRTALSRIVVPITGADFLDPMLGAVFDVAVRLHAEGIHADVIVIAEELEKMGKSGNIIHYVYEIAVNTPTATNVNAYATNVVELSDARRAKATLLRTLERLDSNPRKVREVIGRLMQEVAPTLEAREVSDDLASYDSLPLKAVEWLWDGWLSAGKLHIVGGAPGCGKTTIAVAIASTLSVGGQFPDGSTATTCDSIIWSGEDGKSDTIKPRLILAGANLSRVHFIKRKGRHEFDPATDLDRLRNALRKHPEVKFVVVDPIVSAVAGDGNKNNEVRRALQPLVDLAEEFHVALLGITHFTKGTAGQDPIERITGSVAFSALARIIWVAAKPRRNNGVARILVRAKSNIGPDTGGFEYELRQDSLPDHPEIESSYVSWGNAVEGNARNILAEAEGIPVIGNITGKPEQSTELLEALHDLFNLKGTDRIATVDIIGYLVSLGDPWDSYNKGKPITPWNLSAALKPFGIKPKVFRFSDSDKTIKGYLLADIPLQLGNTVATVVTLDVDANCNSVTR